MPPSYVVGSSYQINWLTVAERDHLDTQPWVFCVNEFLSHWLIAGFRPSVWLYGDNHTIHNVDALAGELAVIRRDPRLTNRPAHRFVALEFFALESRRVVDASGLKVQFYRRGDPWREGQAPAKSLEGQIYHYGSSLTNAVNLAWILNPGEEIRVLSNPFGPKFQHFWHRDNAGSGSPAGDVIWPEVMRCMWRGLSDLRYKHGLPIVDCNAEHEAELPCRALPRGTVLG